LIFDFIFGTKAVKQFILFSGVGVLGTIAHYATLITLVEAWKANAVLASCAGFILGAQMNYYFNYRLAFASDSVLLYIPVSPR
jgi:putative flippase GtrA